MKNRERIRNTNEQERKMHDGCRTRFLSKEIKKQQDEERGYIRAILRGARKYFGEEM